MDISSVHSKVSKFTINDLTNEEILEFKIPHFEDFVYRLYSVSTEEILFKLIQLHPINNYPQYVTLELLEKIFTSKAMKSRLKLFETDCLFIQEQIKLMNI